MIIKKKVLISFLVNRDSPFFDISGRITSNMPWEKIIKPERKGNKPELGFFKVPKPNPREATMIAKPKSIKIKLKIVSGRDLKIWDIEYLHFEFFKGDRLHALDEHRGPVSVKPVVAGNDDARI